jgi:hypothetical protein
MKLLHRTEARGVDMLFNYERVGAKRRVLLAAVFGGVVLGILNWALIAWALA